MLFCEVLSCTSDDGNLTYQSRNQSVSSCPSWVMSFSVIRIHNNVNDDVIPVGDPSALIKPNDPDSFIVEWVGGLIFKHWKYLKLVSMKQFFQECKRSFMIVYPQNTNGK